MCSIDSRHKSVATRRKQNTRWRHSCGCCQPEHWLLSSKWSIGQHHPQRRNRKKSWPIRNFERERERRESAANKYFDAASILKLNFPPPTPPLSPILPPPLHLHRGPGTRPKNPRNFFFTRQTVFGASETWQLDRLETIFFPEKNFANCARKTKQKKVNWIVCGWMDGWIGSDGAIGQWSTDWCCCYWIWRWSLGVMHSTYVRMALDRQRAEQRHRKNRRRSANILRNKLKDCCRKLTAFFFTQVSSTAIL